MLVGHVPTLRAREHKVNMAKDRRAQANDGAAIGR
jgi:hypothetical protein